MSHFTRHLLGSLTCLLVIVLAVAQVGVTWWTITAGIVWALSTITALIYARRIDAHRLSRRR